MNADLSDMQKATGGQAYLIDNDARFGNTASQDILGEMTKLFKQSDVVLHAIDVGGIRVDGDGSARFHFSAPATRCWCRRRCSSVKRRRRWSRERRP